MFTLFSDFNCPFCYALHERLRGLELLGCCAWQGVQHAPYLPVPMKAWSGSLGADLRREVSAVRRLSPELPLNVPAGKPNTGRAIACAADVLSRDHDAGMKLVRKIYHALWADGRDISDAQLLADLAGQPFRLHAEEPGVVSTWTAAWEATGQTGVPLLVAPNDDMLVGCVSGEELRKFFADHP